MPHIEDTYMGGQEEGNGMSITEYFVKSVWKVVWLT